MLRRNKFIITAVFAALFSVVVCSLSWAAVGLYLIPTIKRIDAASASMLVCKYQDKAGVWHGNAACLESRAAGISGSINTAAGAVAKNLPAIAVSIKAAAASSAEASAESVVAARKAGEMLETINQLVLSINDLVGSIQSDIDDVTNHSDNVLASLSQTIDNAGTLAKDLDVQVKQGGPQVRATVDALTKAVGDIDVLLASDDVKTTLRHVAGTSEHLDSSAESIDKVLLPLRKKAALLKTILEKAAGFIKFTFPL